MITRREFSVGAVGMGALAGKAMAAKMMTEKKRYDVAVIGAGPFGAWTAYECRKKGWSVVLVDSRGPGNSMASSGGESRILRVGYGPQTEYSRWAQKSLARWQEALANVRCEHLFLRTGLLWMASQNEPYVQSTIKCLRELGVRFDILDTKQMQKRYPQIRMEANDIGVLELDSGIALARRAVSAVAELAIARGVDYENKYVAEPHGRGTIPEVETADGGRIRADKFVYACGPWLPKVFPEVVGNMIQPTRQEVFFFGVAPGDGRYEPEAFPTWIDFRTDAIFYGMPDVEHRGVKVASDAHGRVVDPDTQERIASEEGLRVVRDFVARRFPSLADAPCVESRVCQYENTKSGDFLIDRHPQIPNVWIVGGGSGHGFKHGPAVGEYVASLLEGGPVDSRFTLETAKKHEGREVH